MKEINRCNWALTHILIISCLANTAQLSSCQNPSTDFSTLHFHEMTDKDPDQDIVLSPSSSIPSSMETLRDRIFFPMLIAGIAGGAFGAISKNRKVYGLERILVAYASNFAIVTGCYCGARELMRVSRTGKPDDLLNSVFGGFASGALLCRLQGGLVGAARYAVMFSVVGTAFDYANLNMKSTISKYIEKKDNWLRLPEWSPIQILDDEDVAAKRAREQEIFKNVHSLHKEDS